MHSICIYIRVTIPCTAYSEAATGSTQASTVPRFVSINHLQTGPAGVTPQSETA
jgi:hypothetical protein